MISSLRRQIFQTPRQLIKSTILTFTTYIGGLFLLCDAMENTWERLKLKRERLYNINFIVSLFTRLRLANIQQTAVEKWVFYCKYISTVARKPAPTPGFKLKRGKLIQSSKFIGWKSSRHERTSSLLQSCPVGLTLSYLLLNAPLFPVNSSVSIAFQCLKNLLQLLMTIYLHFRGKHFLN